MAIGFEAIGRHAVPGPWIESAAYLPVALPDADLAESRATVAMPYALDADIAHDVFVLVDGELHRATAGSPVASVDPSRHLFDVTAGPAVEHGDLDAAFDLAVLATAAELLGAGERVLADSVTYVKQRTQFGRAIGSYQAIKHQLADVRIALDFARPLVFGAAVEPTLRSVSAAKIQAASAANLAARVGLQVHGAIGYTEEHDLSLWLLRIRALQSAWGSTAYHRDRLLSSLLANRSLSLSKRSFRAELKGTRHVMTDLAPTREHTELAASVRNLLERRSDSQAVRRAMEQPAGFDPDLWATLCDQIGVAALAIPEERGGAGFSLVETYVVLEELGRALTPSPLLASVIASAALLDQRSLSLSKGPDPPRTHRRRHRRHPCVVRCHRPCRRFGRRHVGRRCADRLGLPRPARRHRRDPAGRRGSTTMASGSSASIRPLRG